MADRPVTIKSAPVIPPPDLQKVQEENEVFTPEKQVDELSISRVAKTGDTFFGILSLFNLKNREIDLVLQALKKLNITKLFPGDSIVLKRTSDSSFSHIHFFPSVKDKFTISNNDSYVHAQREVLPVSTYTYLLNGFIETSLSEAMFSLGVGDYITAKFADVFAWDINFFIDPRKGDIFQVIFEKKIVNGRICGYGAILAAKYTLNDNRSYFAFGFPDKDGGMKYYDDKGNALQKQFLKAPLQYSRVSSSFSYSRKHPILGIVRPHLGVDYAAPYGTPVQAAADGKIIFMGRKDDYGNLIVISHGGAYQTFYGHLQSFAKNLYPGAYVKQADFIGKVGATGLATGPHLDYRIKRGGSFVNPAKIISPSVHSISKEQMKSFIVLKEKYKYFFENRFGRRIGCFLLDIDTTEPKEPTQYIIKKPFTNVNG